MSSHTFCAKQKTNDCSDGLQNRHTFFLTKAVATALLKACDYVLQFNFKIAHIAGSVETAANFFYRLELKVTENLSLKVREDIQTTPIEVNTAPSDATVEEQFFFTQADNEDKSEEQTFERKGHTRQNAKQWVANEKPPCLKTSMEEFTMID